MKIFNIATFDREYTLLKTVESIYVQADKINIALNLYRKVPKGLYDNKINIYITDNTLGDAYKFLNCINEEGYYFACDDDLIYPSDYADFMTERVERHNRKHIITLHGRSFGTFPIVSYYRSKILHLHCLNDVLKEEKVQFGGTGVMCFHTDLCKIPIEAFKHPNMADIWVGKFAKENNIDILCAEHKKGYIIQQEVDWNIWKEKNRNCALQTEVVNRMFNA